MTNKDISKIFSKIADILELKDENRFKIRAYRNAAQSIQSTGKELSEIYSENPDKIEDIQGIGKDLAAKIIELVTTGDLKYYNGLLKEFPAGFLDLFNIMGLGPKKLKKLRDELKIKNIEDLEKACKEGRLAALEGMGEKTQGKILESISYFKSQSGRMLYPSALEEYALLEEYLIKEKSVKKIEKAGSLRRGLETIGDIDILVVSNDNEKVMDHFSKYKKAKSVIAKGPIKTSVLLDTGTQVDLRVIDNSCFGTALQYFTGSKEHNVKIRKIAKNKGYKVNEYGVFKITKDGKERFTAGKTEKEVYEKLGLEYMAPELREDMGEIEAALTGKLPSNLIALGDIKGDLHMHTVETDGRSTIEEMAGGAMKRGYEYIAITDHSQYARVANGMDEKRLLKHMERIRKADGKIKGIKLLTGVEVDILEDGSLDIKDEVLKELDVVVASVHSFFDLDREKQTARVLKAMENKYVNIIAHPSARIISKRVPIKIDFDAVFKAAASLGVYMEINTHGERIDLKDVHSRRAKELGARFAINSDSHDAGQFRNMAHGIIAARRGWVEKDDVVNTLPLKSFLKAIKRR